MEKFKTAKLTCKNGYSWETSINPDCSDDSIRRYFVGEAFNTAPYPQEIMSVCVSCEIAGVCNG